MRGSVYEKIELKYLISLRSDFAYGLRLHKIDCAF